MDIRPFQPKLKKINKEEQRLLSALFDFLPKTGMRAKFHGAVKEALGRHLGMDASYYLEAVNQDNFAKFSERMPDPAVFIILGMPPREGKIIIELDEHLVALFIEKLLGGTGESIPAPKPISDTEQGVLQYLVLQVLSRVYRLCGGEARLHFRFEKFIFTPKGLKGIAEPDEIVSELTMKVIVGKHSGFVKLFFPSPLIEQQYLNVEAKGDIRQAEKDYLMDRIYEFGYVSCPVWAEAGHTTITASDMQNLEVGDVVVLDATEIKLSDAGISGRAILRVGEGGHGGFLAELSMKPKKVSCRIVDVQKGEELL